MSCDKCNEWQRAAQDVVDLLKPVEREATPSLLRMVGRSAGVVARDYMALLDKVRKLEATNRALAEDEQ